MRELLRRMYCKTLVHGNMTDAEARALHKDARDRSSSLALEAALPVALTHCPPCRLRWQPVLTRADLHEGRVLVLPRGAATYVHSRASNPKETNSACEVYLQIGPQSVRLRSLVNLLEQCIGEHCFDQLRTKEQLGYQVRLVVAWHAHVPDLSPCR